jgi:hypothetical protein
MLRKNIIIVLLMFNICGLYVLDSYSSSSFDWYTINYFYSEGTS